jgi:hypothetical protein
MTTRQTDFLENVERKAKSLWLGMTLLWDVHEGRQVMDGQITEIRIKRPRFEGDDTMVIVKALADGKKFVAFHTSDSAPGALAGAMARLEQKQLKWREDAYQTDLLPDGGGAGE